MSRTTLQSTAAAIALPEAKPPAIFTQPELADYLRLSIRTLQRLHLIGEGPRAIMLSERRIGYRLEDVQDWVASRVVASTSAATVARDHAA